MRKQIGETEVWFDEKGRKCTLETCEVSIDEIPTDIVESCDRYEKLPKIIQWILWKIQKITGKVM
jgi:hypothetical protein